MSVLWNGEGLPPAGCKCELFDCEDWNPVMIKFVGDKYVVTERTDLGYEVVYCVAERPERFRPILTEAQRKREQFIDAVSQVEILGFSAIKSFEDAAVLYDAIAAGKIPHITLK